MREHYEPRVLERSRRLYDAIRPWLRERDDVTLIGGWAVFESVLPGRAQQSRDLDLVMHTPEALYAFSGRLTSWGLQWRTRGRNRFNDCHVIGEDPGEIVVDVLKATAFEDHLFKGPRMRGVPMIKPLPYRQWLPPVPFLIEDKLRTAPSRIRDAEDKRLKDLLDTHNLVFYNREGIAPLESRASIPGDIVDRVRPLVEAAKERDRTRYDGTYEADLDALGRWLDRKP